MLCIIRQLGGSRWVHNTPTGCGNDLPARQTPFWEKKKSRLFLTLMKGAKVALMWSPFRQKHMSRPHRQYREYREHRQYMQYREYREI